LVLTRSSAPNDVRVVAVRVIPVVAFPFGSFVASANRMLASATKPLHTEGVVAASAFAARKSLLSTATWLLICASEMFSSVFLEKTWTTTGTVISCRATRAAKPDALVGLHRTALTSPGLDRGHRSPPRSAAQGVLQSRFRRRWRSMRRSTYGPCGGSERR
jgi:hypothetical protein